MIFGIIQKTIENDAVWSPDVGSGKIWAFEPITSLDLAVEVHGVGATSSLEDVAPDEGFHSRSNSTDSEYC